MNIEQSPKVTVAAIKQLANGREGDIHIHQNSIAVQITGRTGVPYIPDFVPEASAMDVESLLILLNSFPDPKIKNFLIWIRWEAIKKFGNNKTAAARWLGENEKGYQYRPSYHPKWQGEERPEYLALPEKPKWIEKEKLIDTLRENKGNLERTSRILGYNRSSIAQAIRRFGLSDFVKKVKVS